MLLSESQWNSLVACVLMIYPLDYRLHRNIKMNLYTSTLHKVNMCRVMFVPALVNRIELISMHRWSHSVNSRWREYSWFIRNRGGNQRTANKCAIEECFVTSKELLNFLGILGIIRYRHNPAPANLPGAQTKFTNGKSISLRELKSNEYPAWEMV